jgi:uncharacterized protein
VPSQFRAISAYFLLPLAAVAFMEGCGESVKSPPAAQEAVKLSPEQEFAALANTAEAGDAEAQLSLGQMYVNGEGVSKDVVKAVEWFQKAASQGHPKAQFSLGKMYYLGESVPKDAVKAVEWYQKAAEQGYANAQFNLGKMYQTGEGVQTDLAKAVEWYEKAAAQGNADAQGHLGGFYYAGYGVQKDAAKAFEWTKKAAEQGGDGVQYNLGVMYQDGHGVPKDSAKAVEWYQKSAAQGNADAQINLSVAYNMGEGVLADQVLSYAWANLATVSGKKKYTATLFRDLFPTSSMTKVELAEAQRLSSNWKKGEILARDGSPHSGASSVTTGKLSKTGTGTIFLVSKSGHAITNQHVASNCTELRIQGREGLAKLITDDTVNDLALLQVQGSVTDTSPLSAEPANLRQGEDIVVFGFPLNSVLSSGGNLTPGVVSALTGLGNNTNQIQITAPVQPGSSGSPVLNKKGEIVGVVSKKLDDVAMAKATGQLGQNVNFAVSGQTLKTFLDTHKVSYISGSGFFAREKTTADLADEARKWTLVVECWK